MKDEEAFCWSGFSLPKRGNTPEEYEDVFAVNPQAGRFAIADGASESAFAGSWARILVDGCVASTGRWSSWLPAARSRWRELCERQDLPWFLESKLEEGAFAALLGVVVGPARNGKRRIWKARAVGDCCLFQIRQDCLIRIFPVARSADFDNRPPLLGSPRSTPRVSRQRTRGSWRSGDYLFLMSDALAQWFLLSFENGERPWELLLALQMEEDFERTIDELRDEQKLRNDDVTFLVIRGGQA